MASWPRLPFLLVRAAKLWEGVRPRPLLGSCRARRRHLFPDHGHLDLVCLPGNNRCMLLFVSNFWAWKSRTRKPNHHSRETLAFSARQHHGERTQRSSGSCLRMYICVHEHMGGCS
ncbi:hypothetical protein B0T19DRAFT_408218 [Cercophora scortea]|uniref:Uncharacterized protein n=1 Tax=Cercophora scortea TaxID=314031 RepID=A0AAE0J3S9_9PEZI|nr:hypothetical protein B0T19DRAFT_408218 [Cercophora scortea]